MWLYWEKKGRADTDEIPPLEIYDRICTSCGNKLSLHHALIHLLNASGYRDVDVGFNHQLHLASFANCPFCFGAIGWHPGKPPPPEEISPERAMKAEQIERLRDKLESERDCPKDRSRRISEVLKKRAGIDTSLAEFIEISAHGLNTAEKSSKRVDSPAMKPVYPQRPEWIFGSDYGVNFPNQVSETEISEGEVELGDEYFRIEPATSFEKSEERSTEALEVEISFEDDPDPLLEGVSRCPNHPGKNSDRSCPFCHRSVCSYCMAFVEGVYACRDCFGDHKIRRMYSIPNDWESRKSINLEPDELPDRMKGFGIIKIDSEGAPATSLHRFCAHAIDGLLAAIIAGISQFLFSFPLSGFFERLSEWVVTLLNADGPAMLQIYSNAEALGRTLGFGGLFDAGLSSGFVWWAVCWPLITWIFIGLTSPIFMRSPGQQLCNLALVDASGRWISFVSGFFKSLLAIPGVLSLGLLAILDYALGPAPGVSLTDSWLNTRVVTFSGTKWQPARDMRIARVAVLPLKHRRGSETAADLQNPR